MVKDSSTTTSRCPLFLFLREGGKGCDREVDIKSKGVYPPYSKINFKTGGQTPVNNSVVSITNAKSIFKEVMEEPALKSEISNRLRFFLIFFLFSKSYNCVRLLIESLRLRTIWYNRSRVYKFYDESRRI